MPAQSSAQQHIYEELRNMISGLRDDLSKVKTQTGELVSTRNQISEIERMLRGHDGQRGLMGRFDLVETALIQLVDVQIPSLVESIKLNTKTEVELCQAGRLLAHEQLKNELAILRTEYKAYIEQTGKEQSREEIEEAKFGGREWFRQNASGIVIAVVTAIVVIIASGIVQEIIAILHH